MKVANTENHRRVSRIFLQRQILADEYLGLNFHVFKGRDSIG